MKTSEMVALNDRIVATGTSTEILEGVVTAVDDTAELVFFTTADGEDLVVEASQITDNFGPLQVLSDIE